MSEDYHYGDYNRGGMWAFAFAISVTLIFFIYIAFIHQGVSLNEIEKSSKKTEQSSNQPTEEE